jgi:hypothetical protein
MRRSFILPVSIIALALCSSAATAQTRTFTDADEGYALELPSQSWGAVRRPEGFNRHTDFVYRGGGDCRLHVHREMVDGGVTTVALSDEDGQRLRLLPGYVENKHEPFAGRLSGTKLTYEYSDGGRLMAARIYYLQADKRTVYVLRFTGARERLATLRGDADSIARSFRPVPSAKGS